MQNKQGFALLGLVIALVLLAVIVTIFYLGKNGSSGQNAIENYVSAEQKAKDANKLMQDAQNAQQKSVDQVK
jgi:uncharacterized protein (UPF0333 family)